MPDLSLTAANQVSNIGNFALIGGAFIVLLGTWLTIWSGGQKERYADERISTNEAQTATANADAAKAIRETEGIRKENLTLSLKLEQEHAARLKIESGLASRRVTGNKREALVNALRDLKPSPILYLQRVVGDAEARKFGDDLLSAFGEADIKVEDMTASIGIGFPEGLTIIHTDDPESRKIAKAFKDAGVVATIQNGQVQAGFTAIAIVGLKPPSF